jgi:hypothetical protein
MGQTAGANLNADFITQAILTTGPRAKIAEVFSADSDVLAGNRTRGVAHS